MALTKYASLESAEVLELKSSPERSKQASLRTLSDFHDYRTEDGYLYARIRAISSRVNKNHDGWPTAELAGGQEAWERISSQHTAAEGGFTVEASKDSEYGYSTFIGKPHFVDHHNSDPDRTRGVVVDAKFNVLDQKTAAEHDEYWGSSDVDKEHFPPSEVELLIEVDAKTFPKLAKAIVDGDIDGFSMGCDVDYSKCSHCGHEASTPDEYCSHIAAKGAEFDFTSSEGKTSSKKSYENCYGIKFFEISAVFDPADDTALAKEIRAEGRESKTADLGMAKIPCPHCHGGGFIGGSECPNCLGTGTAGPEAKTIDIHGGDGAHSEQAKLRDFQARPNELPIGGVGITPRYQGSFLSSKTGSTKTAQPEEPQVDHVKAPEEVDTTREEKICDLCGSNMENGKCDVCGYEEPPESLQNPDLQKAQQQVEQLDIQEGQHPSPDPAPGAPDQAAGGNETYLNARNPHPASTLTSEMRWAPRIQLPKKLAAPKPQGDEPTETVISDESTPVTSAFRTAQDMIQAAKRNHKENTMSDQTKVAADPADASGNATKQVDVTGVGGVLDATAEAAGKANGNGTTHDKHLQVNVTDKGGIDGDNASTSAPSSTESLATGENDNAGFQDGGQTGPDTQTWPNSNEPDSAVTNEAFPTDGQHGAANKGTQPADPVGKAQDRIDVETPPHDQVGPDTQTWSGTSGNGVTKQQDAVTSVPTQSGGVKASGLISLAALKLAEAEIELGITSKDDKFNRLAELNEVPEDQILAEHRALAKVKTAGLTRTASAGGTSRLPSFKRIASEETPEPQPVNDELLDSSLFG